MAIIDTVLNSTKSVSGALSGISKVSTAVGNLSNRIQTLTDDRYKSPGAIRDINTNGFLAQNSIFTPDYFSRAFDEPTYLSFRIEFIMNPDDIGNFERNISYNTNGATLDTAMSSTMYSKMFDKMPEPFLDEYVVSNMDSSLGKRYSTETYLDMNLGDHGRASLLHTLKLALKDLQEVFPFYFKSISGLSTLTKVDSKNGARLKDAKITIDCYEGLDLKITQILNLYRKIVWDDVYQRWALPDMMRFFGMRIYVSEIRMFHDLKSERNTSANTLMNMNTTDARNATYDPTNISTYGKVNNIINEANALTNAYLGTKSHISKALGYAAQGLTAANDVIGAINSINGDIGMCDNAINTVLPTICFECHMCEFDISDTMNHIDSLQSSTRGNNSPSPKISIKVGQVTEKHSYPLNKTLRYNDNGYYKTVKDHRDGYGFIDNENITKFTDLQSKRDNEHLFIGNYLYDDALVKRYSKQRMGDRITEYVDNLQHISGDEETVRINEQKYVNPKIIDNLGKMTYNRETMTQGIAKLSLVAAGLNEAKALGAKINLPDEIIGTDSLATNQDYTIKNAVKHVGEALQEAVDRIYNGSEMKSMALSDDAKAKIANNMFNEFIEDMDSKATDEQNPILKNTIRQYKVLMSQDTNDSMSKATDSRNKIQNFSPLN